MMTPSYGRLIDDHHRIEALANEILSALRSASPSTTDLAYALGSLRFLVDEHLEVERGIIAACSEMRLAQSWAELMRTGRDDFERLCADWILFLDDWSAELIAADLDGFRSAAHEILSRLNARVQAETKALYATGLQIGAISLQ